MGTAHSVRGQWTRSGTRAEDRSLHSGDITHHSLGTQQLCGSCQVFQEDGGRGDISGRNPERPALTGTSAQQPYPGSSGSRKPPSTACPRQDEGSRFADTVSPEGFGKQLCTEDPPTREAGAKKGVGSPAWRHGCRRARGGLRHGLGSAHGLSAQVRGTKEGTIWQPRADPLFSLHPQHLRSDDLDLSPLHILLLSGSRAQSVLTTTQCLCLIQGCGSGTERPHFLLWRQQ